MYVKCELFMAKILQGSANICSIIGRRIVGAEERYDSVLAFPLFLIQDRISVLRERTIRNVCTRGSEAMKKRH